MLETNKKKLEDFRSTLLEQETEDKENFDII